MVWCWDIFWTCTVGERCLLRAQYEVTFIGWRVKERLIASARWRMNDYKGDVYLLVLTGHSTIIKSRQNYGSCAGNPNRLS
jgi:hypothetical protein